MSLAAGYDGPPRLTYLRLISMWELDPVLVAIVAVLAAGYLAGVWRLVRRGDHWPVGRTVAFLGGGLGSIVVTVLGGLGVYDDTLFWSHMVQHMVLTMVTPVLLALGAPITLALRTLPRRPRGWLLAALHSRVARLLTFPVVAWASFVATPVALYFTGWYEVTLRGDLWHDLLHVQLVAVGCQFLWPLLGIDPMPRRLPYPARMLLAFLALPFHAILGVALMMSTTVLAGDYYRGLHRPWGPTPAVDQYTAGAVMWVSGDLLGLLFFAVIFVQWVRDDDRGAARSDRRADLAERRAEPDELARYNAWLAALARGEVADDADRRSGRSG